ncbi:GNAT family N-acetyltransferase [Jannaschia sp. Os4]|uniref:GNAT family N-acetyltransferase n=1 Tax=Jannaschia sp. Os4 TaxID=2807617 RepID=UPI00193A5DF0|nr:GNAT family N-acetyltransferase [Jannaschia sp. Os4]MBM2575169.1 GNAT family N-acetyltransferase [Jannaschia sp. Os4]
MDWQALIDAAWPPERVERAGPWTLRVAPGAGGRVNAITGPEEADVAEAEAAARALGQTPRFVIWRDGSLDAALADKGYVTADAVWLWRADAATLAGDPLPHATAFAHWPPLQVARDVWAEGGIGDARQAVMARAAEGPGGAAILARRDDRVAGAGFVGLAGDAAMVSAIHVLPAHRRKGAAALILRAAAAWARDRGASTLALVVTRGNAPANSLYASIGMERVAGYHYRIPGSAE